MSNLGERILKVGVIVLAFVVGAVGGACLAVAALLLGGPWGLLYVGAAILVGWLAFGAYRGWANRHRRKLAELIAEHSSGPPAGDR